MAYKADNDKLIKLFENVDENGSGLLYSVMSYNNGEKKLQMSRTYKKADGSMGYGNTGRLTVKELEWLTENLKDIITSME